MKALRPEGCLSDFALDRRLAGETPREQDASTAHLRTCARCAAREGELRAERDAFARDAPAFRVPDRMPARAFGAASAWRRARLIGGSATVVGLAAAAILFIHGASRGTEGALVERTKGSGAFLGVYVKHADAVRAGGAGERVEPGDALRFVYSAAGPGYLAVLSLDGARRASVYYPDAKTAARADPGAQVALPASTVLDDVLGPETVYGVSCPGPFDVEPLRRDLEAAGTLAAPEGCAIDQLSLRKEAPAGR